jgi:protein-S-isoprenylcysteine O-methyltransferase Ste14
MRWKHWIDSHKGATPLFILVLMALYGRWDNAAAWVYLGLHGTYGILWVLKSKIFPDMQWEARAGIFRGLYIWAGLSLYWIAPWLIISGNLQAPAWLLGLAVSACTFGVFLHFASDMQKHVALALNPGHLITDGLFARSRNANYLGEFLIYAGFGSLAQSWIPFAVLALFLALVWVPNMLRKDRSLARYPEFADYRRRSRLVIPFLL